MESVANLLFVIRHRVSRVKGLYAPVKAAVIEEYTKNSKHKLTNEAREQLVSGDARCSAYAETIDIGSLLIDQITDIKKTLDQRYSMIFEKSVEARHDRKL
jgi:predicted nucleic acid-binding protein